MNKSRFPFATFLCIANCVVAAPAQNWTLVWSDEFTQPNGSAPDSTKWGYDVGGTGWGNNELEYYTSRTNNARIEGGQLVIEARKERYRGKNYTSARLLTKGKWSWTYGRIEARIKIPRGQGLWPALWMLGANADSVGWPTCGEIDIMENIGHEPGTVHGTLHGPGYSGSGGIGGSFASPGGAAFADDFHVFAVQWETSRIRWFVDNQPYFSVTPTNLPAGTHWVFDAPPIFAPERGRRRQLARQTGRHHDLSSAHVSGLREDLCRDEWSGPLGNALTNPEFELNSQPADLIRPLIFKRFCLSSLSIIAGNRLSYFVGTRLAIYPACTALL